MTSRKFGSMLWLELILWLRINTDEQSEGGILAAEREIEMTEELLHTVVPRRKVAAGFPTVLRAVPNDSLGGALNFKKKPPKERWTLGEEKTDQFIREYRALLEPIIAAARLDPGVVA